MALSLYVYVYVCACIDIDMQLVYLSIYLLKYIQTTVKFNKLDRNNAHNWCEKCHNQVCTHVGNGNNAMITA